MSSLAIAARWIMTNAGPKAGPQLGAWRRDVVVTWAMATVLAGALAFWTSSHDKQTMPAIPWSLAPTAGHAHHLAADPEGPASDEACSDRDYANERC